MVRALFPANPLISVSGREPRAAIFGFSGPAAGLVRARLPAKPLVSVSGREPRAGIFGFGGTAAGLVRARFPANPLASVSGREPRAGIFGFSGPATGLVRARLPAKPLVSVSGREPRAGIFRFSGPATGLVRAPFPANPLVSVSGREPRAGIFGFSGTAAGLVRARVPANPLISVSGREPRAGIFEFGGPPAGYLVCRFAPRSPLALIPPFRGAKSSHNSRPESAGLPSIWPAGLLPAPREALCLRFGEQNLHTISAPPPGAGRLFHGPVCSPLSASPCSSVPGSKIFTQFPHPHLGPAGFSMARFAPRSPLALVLPFRGANFFTSGLPTPLVTSRPPMYNCYV